MSLLIKVIASLLMRWILTSHVSVCFQLLLKRSGKIILSHTPLFFIKGQDFQIYFSNLGVKVSETGYFFFFFIDHQNTLKMELKLEVKSSPISESHTDTYNEF